MHTYLDIFLGRFDQFLSKNQNVWENSHYFFVKIKWKIRIFFWQKLDQIVSSNSIFLTQSIVSLIVTTIFDKNMWFIGLERRSEPSLTAILEDFLIWILLLHLSSGRTTYLHRWHIFFYYWVKRLERIGAEPRGGDPWLIFIFILCYMAWKANLILKLSKCQKLKPHLTNGWLIFE